MKKLTDNTHRGEKAAPVPDKGTNTGVSDKYGANLNKGTSSCQKIPPKKDGGTIGFA